MKPSICDICPLREHCKTPCKAVRKLLQEGNPGVMERWYERSIVCYPKAKEVHFSELTEEQLDQLSEDDRVVFSSPEHRLRKTTVFYERFFNKTPCRELAERFNVKENTIVCMYKQAVEQIEKILEVLDQRKTGLKAVKASRFTDEERQFLLVHAFGFSAAEVARMYDQNPKTVKDRVKRMADRFQFNEKRSSYEGMTREQITERIAM